MSTTVTLVAHGTEGSPPAGPYAFATVRPISGASPFPGGSDLDFRWNEAISDGSPYTESWALLYVEIGNNGSGTETLALTPLDSSISPGSSQPYGVMYQQSLQVTGTVNSIDITDWPYSVTVGGLDTYPDATSGDSSYVARTVAHDYTDTPSGIELSLEPGAVIGIYWYVFDGGHSGSTMTDHILSYTNTFELTAAVAPAGPTDFWTGFVDSHEVP